MQGEAENGGIPESIGIPNLSEAIEKLKAHPEILSMAASVLGSKAETADSATPEETPHEEEPSVSTAGTPTNAPGSPLDALPELLGLLGPMLTSGGNSEKRTHHGKNFSRSTALLLALKPYLSASRCDTVDKLVQLGKIGEVFEKLY